jgi:hypothetical protein
MEGLIEGRIVHYVVNSSDVKAVNESRECNHVFGNHMMAGEHFSAIVVRVLGEGSLVNLKVFLDGDDFLWATSRNFAEPAALGNGTWHWVEKA